MSTQFGVTRNGSEVVEQQDPPPLNEVSDTTLGTLGKGVESTSKGHPNSVCGAKGEGLAFVVQFGNRTDRLVLSRCSEDLFVNTFILLTQTLTHKLITNLAHGRTHSIFELFGYRWFGIKDLRVKKFDHHSIKGCESDVGFETGRLSIDLGLNGMEPTSNDLVLVVGLACLANGYQENR